ncbi:AfsR/SARP family transcriptional regulator [Kibdelosporangium phytohabitans]|uniref:OmpR/PhoB-type domain-containing protein n=1 Tax=Kibdelosporangium phytohabitans TaxID=860235 RepID=A0A0N9I5Q2_9PSEU|nr:BTAD domain-containing putative transcriptional regulator [Kibdelosporangium phytohabitans]ALG09750.1 hypothetical protein AOZ06_25160 [Kibdelosporangium phytohabitans]MBE1468880.1 DNA-binding SARP family transcriptional activator/tetratricopeptide (TPR) repeat protein [Kibdelosporangium phytohabitans]
MTTTVRFGLLGEVMAWGPDGPIDIGHPRQRHVLAALLVDANRLITVDQLFDRVWGDQPPQSARSTLFTYLTRLRQALAPVPIERSSGGYRITVHRDALDLDRFHRLLAEARETSDDHVAAEVYRRAFELWRGEPLPDLDTPWAYDIRGLLGGRRFAAELDYTDVRLRLGEHATVLADLTTRAAEHPLDERLAGQLMLALYRSGRLADALEHYQDFRGRLAEELGVDPGQSLRDLHGRILESTRATPPRALSAARPPRQLPPDLRSFAGRAPELAGISARFGGAAGAAGICTIGGGGGVGKTSLALHWAHRNAAHFPDGQLFVNLRGFDVSGRPTEPSAVLHGFLSALGITESDIPTNLDGQVNLYRSLLAGKRMLVLLDNAADTAQVSPLLPGSSTVCTVVTSRHPLTGLVALHAAHVVTLDVLSSSEAYELLSSRLGATRLAAEPDAVSAIVEHCAGLPLALGIVAARASVQPDLALTDLAAQLRDHTTRLDGLETGEVNLGLRAVFESSYQALEPAAAKLACLIGLAPGPDISTAAADILAGGSASRLLEQLESAHLITQPSPGRYRMHDLVRLDATERAGTLPARVREDAVRQLVAFYLRTAHAADRLLDPHRPVVVLSEFGADQQPLALADHDDAERWLTTEHPCLLATQQAAAEHGWFAQVWELSLVTDTLHWRHGRTAEHLDAMRTALDAAQAAGDLDIQRRLHQNLGQVLARAGSTDDAVHHLERALAVAEQIGNVVDQGHARMTLAQVSGQQGDNEHAAHHAVLALERYQTAGATRFEATALNQLGWISALLGKFDEARAHCEAALALPLPEGIVHAETLDSLGYIHERTGRLTDAVSCYQRSVEVFSEKGDTYNVATTLIQLGRALAALGSAEAAAVWRRALELCEIQQRSKEADELRQRLAGWPGE